MCSFKGRLRIQRSVQSSVNVKFGDDLRLDWDGRGRVLLKVESVLPLKMFLLTVHMCGSKRKSVLNTIYFFSWAHNGQGGPVGSVVTTMVTKAMTSCLVLDLLRRVLRHLVNRGG